jgi:hypothetical protein
MGIIVLSASSAQSAVAFAFGSIFLCASVSLWWILFLDSNSFFSVRSVSSVVNLFAATCDYRQC